MSALSEAQEALAAAQVAQGQAQVTATSARVYANELRRRLAAGDGEGIAATELTRADAEAERAELLLQGAEAPLPDLSAAVRSARADETCDEIVARLPQLGTDVVRALEAVDATLDGLVSAVRVYDGFIHEATHSVEAARESDRVKLARMNHATVDQCLSRRAAARIKWPPPCCQRCKLSARRPLSSSK